MTPQETARAMLALYDGKPERWTRGALARAADGQKTCPRSEAARCWCLSGAIERVTGAYYLEDIHDAIRAAHGDWLLLTPHWNDKPERTFHDVIALLTRIAESDGKS